MSQPTAFILIFCLFPLLFMALSYRGKIKGTLKGEENISEVLQVPEKSRPYRKLNIKQGKSFEKQEKQITLDKFWNCVLRYENRYSFRFIPVSSVCSVICLRRKL